MVKLNLQSSFSFQRLGWYHMVQSANPLLRIWTLVPHPESPITNCGGTYKESPHWHKLSSVILGSTMVTKTPQSLGKLQRLTGHTPGTRNKGQLNSLLHMSMISLTLSIFLWFKLQLKCSGRGKNSSRIVELVSGTPAWSFY